MSGPLANSSRWTIAALGAILAGALAVVGGCGDRRDAFARFVPGPEPARRALAASLDAWVRGEAPGEVVAGGAKVRLVDHHRRPGQRLRSYEILGEVATDRARGFAVRLSLEDPDERPVVRFVVFGIDPLWVFRQEDYEMFAHWEHLMDEPKVPPAEVPAAP